MQNIYKKTLCISLANSSAPKVQQSVGYLCSHHTQESQQFKKVKQDLDWADHLLPSIARKGVSSELTLQKAAIKELSIFSVFCGASSHILLYLLYVETCLLYLFIYTCIYGLPHPHL